MKPRTKITVPLFQFTGLLALFLTGWAAARLYEITPAVDENHGRLLELRDRFLGLGEAVRTNFAFLDEALTNVLQRTHPAANERLQGGSQQWIAWLDGERQRANKNDAESASSTQSHAGLVVKATNQIAQYQREWLSLLDGLEDFSTRYFAEVRYLTNNTGKPLISKRLAEHEKMLQSWRSKLLDLAGQAHLQGNGIQTELSQGQQRSKAVMVQVQRLRLFLLLAVLVSCFLFLLRRSRRKHAEASEAIHRHAEQQAKLDRLTFFSSQVAQEHAHEIKQPLTAINAHLYTLQKTLAAGSAPHKDATVIRSEINRLGQIVEKFLQQARSTQPHPVALTADKVLGEVRDLMTSQLEQQAIKVKFEVEEAAEFRADPDQLKQVLINLVKNAAETIAREGVITLRAKHGTWQLNGEAEAVTILEVEDTGGGIPTEIQAKIFDPFFSTKQKGSGLGLAISARIIEQHGGRLEFDTRVGEGTIFRIVLPASRKEPTA